MYFLDIDFLYFIYYLIKKYVQLFFLKNLLFLHITLMILIQMFQTRGFQFDNLNLQHPLTKRPRNATGKRAKKKQLDY